MFNQEQILRAAVHLEDLKSSLERYQNTLKFPLKSRDSFRAALTCDAQIYTFCECVLILRALLETLFNPEQKRYQSFVDFLHDLYTSSVLDKGAYSSFSTMALAEEIFRFDRGWLDAQESGPFIDSLSDLPRYYQCIVEFAGTMTHLIWQLLQIEKQKEHAHEQ